MILYSNYVTECQGNYHSGTSILRAAKKMDPGQVEKYIIYVREQEHMLKVNSQASGESTLDLVSYVEFQRNFRYVGSSPATPVRRLCRPML